MPREISEARLNHPNRCQAKLKRGPCGGFALAGSKYCRFHGGRKTAVRVDLLPRFWSKRLNGTLKNVVEEALEADPADVVNLYEELAIMRQTVADATILYEAALDLADPKLIADIGPVVREGMKDIADMVKKVVDIESARADKLSVHNIQFVVNQIVRIAYETFDADELKGERFRKAVQEKLRVERPGTDLEPTRDVEDMDATVPEAP